MFNYRITRVHVGSVFKYTALIGLIIGSGWGLFLGLLAHTMAGMLEGLIFALVFGLFNGIFASIYAILFNLLASSLKGVEIQLTRKDSFLEELVQPIPLVHEPPVDPVAENQQTAAAAKNNE